MAVGIPSPLSQDITAGSGGLNIDFGEGEALPGETIFAFVTLSNLTATLNSVTDTAYGNVFTILGPFTGTNWRIYVAICNPVTRRIPLRASSTVLTMAFSAGTYTKAARLIKIPFATTGIKVASPVDVTTAVNSGTGTALSSPSSGTLAQADEILIAMTVQAGTTVGDKVTFGAPFLPVGTEMLTSGHNLHLGYYLSSSTAAQAVAATMPNSRNWSCMLMSLKAGPLTGDTRRFAQEIIERDVSGITRQVTSLQLEADVRGDRRAVSKVSLEADFLQSAVRLASLELEADTRGKTPSLAQVILETDFSENSRKGRVRPKIIG